GCVHAARDLPLAISGFEVRSDLKTSRVQVTFAGVTNVLTFEHPSAPRVDVDSWVVTFPDTPVGESATTQLKLRNRGKHQVEIDVSQQEGEFRVSARGRCTVAPGGEMIVPLVFAPAQSGQRTGQFAVRPLRAPKELKVQLRGIARERVVAEASKTSVG